MEAYISISVFCGIYTITGIFLVLRSNTAIISARSYTLLYISHMGNLLETITMLLIIYGDSLNIASSNQKYSLLLLSLSGIFHFFTYFTYILRSYRLYLIFSLEEEPQAHSNLSKRTTQNWLLKALCVLTIPVVLIYSIFYFIALMTETYPSLETNSPYLFILLFTNFLENLSLVIINYLTRNIVDDFKMNLELIFVTFLYFLTPTVSVFVNSDKRLYWVYVIRNLLLIVISSVVPIVLSYIKSVDYQILSNEMLSSLELIILHKSSLSAFESFLDSYRETCIQDTELDARVVLDLVFSIECWNDSRDEQMLSLIKKKIIQCGFEFNLAEDDGQTGFEEIKRGCLEYLKNKYFLYFQNSSYMEKLRKQAYRNELYQVKINNSSLQRKGVKLRIDSSIWQIN